MTQPKIIAENDKFLVVNKPAGLIVHSDGRTVEPTLTNWLTSERPSLQDVGKPWVSPQGERIAMNGIVHRLDRTTSGILLVAKTNEMFSYLKNEFKERRIHKTYRAYVYGRLPTDEGTIVAEIMRSSKPPKRWYARPCEKDDIRAAITDWKVLGHVAQETTYIEAHPVTGRTHQIRVHMASIGHPIVGDHLYAADKAAILAFTRPALHAHSISLTLPDGTSETFTAPLPPDFNGCS